MTEHGRPNNDEKFLAYLHQVREEVRSWPEWMRGVLSRYIEVKPTSEDSGRSNDDNACDRINAP
jgi:hypothetical protein